MATIGKIKCDLCNFVGNLETVNGQANMKTPIGWAYVYPTVKMTYKHGTRKTMTKEEAEGIEQVKEKIARRVHTMHICPGCINNEKTWQGDGPLKLAQANGSVRG
jgi:hypothetical protein